MKKGFTLIELLVVIAIIGLLASVVLISVNTARAKARDTKRIDDIKQIQQMLEIYIDENGSLPMPADYGEENSSPTWWDGRWDLSTGDGDGDGIYFLDFLVDGEIATVVPVDPINTPVDFNGHPNDDGYFYLYYVAPQGYIYQGGSCVVSSQSVYMLGIRSFEEAASGSFNSGCPCLWQNVPDYFQNRYDYITCGTF